MDKRLKNYIISQMRLVAYRTINTEREAAKKAAKVDKSLWECQQCQIKLYDGSSMKNFNVYKEKFGEEGILWQKPQMDHIKPVSDNKNGWKDWNVFMDSLFCPKENYQAICKSCHHIKTSEEAAERAASKKAKKKLAKKE